MAAGPFTPPPRLLTWALPSVALCRHAGMSTPAAAALLLDSQRDSNSPHHHKQGRAGPGAPDSGGKSGGSGSGGTGSGGASGVPGGASPLSEELAAPLAPAPPSDMGCGQAQEAPTAAQAQQQRGGSAGPAPSPLLLLPGLLSAAAHHRKRPLSQDAEGHYKRSRFAIESQEAAEEAAAAAGAAEGSPQGPGAADPANTAGPAPQAAGGLGGHQDGAEPEGGAGLCTGPAAGGASGCQPTLGLVGSEGEGGIICTQPPHITAEPPPATVPPGCQATATAAWQGAAPTAAWEALALAEQWAAAGTPQLLARSHAGLGDATPQLGLSLPGTTPMAVTLGAGTAAAIGRGPAALHPSVSKFAGAAPGATPRFIFPSSCGDGPSPPAGEDSGAGTVQGA